MKLSLPLFVLCVVNLQASAQDFYPRNDSLLSVHQFAQVRQNCQAELAAGGDSLESNYFLALATLTQDSESDATSISVPNPYLEEFQRLYRAHVRAHSMMHGDQMMLSDSRFVKLFYLIGLQHFVRKDFRHAAEWMNLAKVPYNDVYEFNFYQGCSYLAIRELDKAKDYFDIALRIKPNDPATTYNMACLFSLQNDVDESVKWLRLALSLDPEYKQLLRSDADFNNVRPTKQFQDLLGN